MKLRILTYPTVFIKLILLLGYCLYQAMVNIIAHEGFEYAGYLAFLLILSLFPFLILLVAVTADIATFLANYSLTKEHMAAMVDKLPYDLTYGILPRINEIISGPPSSLLNLAIISSIWTCSSVLHTLKAVLNRVYNIEVPIAYLWQRLLSILQFMLGVFIIAALMVALSVIPGIIKLTSSNDVWQYVTYSILLVLTFFSVCLAYYFIPSRSPKFIEVMPGALIVLLLFIISNKCFNIYLKSIAQVNLIYGSLGGIIIIMLFFYIMNFCFIYGAEFNYILSYIRTREKITNE